MKIKQDIDFLVIIGPTGVGKTKLSIELAKQYNGEIINGDSVQVYKKLNIGSAKITKEEMGNIPHHLLSIKEPYEQYTVSDFKKDCNNKIQEIKNKNKLPIVVGGTGLYINAIIYNYSLLDQKEDLDLKDKLQNYSNEKLYSIVKQACDDQGIEIHINNKKRLLSYAYKVLKNIPLKENLKMKNCQIISLSMDREKLYNNINNRVDQMINDGLVKEVKQFDSSWPSQTAIGYKEVHLYLQNKLTYEEMIDKIKQNTRNFAKRQITWANNQIKENIIEVKK